MVDSTVRDLFASLENTLRERFRLIEDVLRYRSSSDMQLEEVHSSSVQLDSVLQDEVRSLREELASMRGFFHTKLSKLEGEVHGLRTQLYGSAAKKEVVSPLICSTPLSGIEIIPKKEVVVHMNTQQVERPLEVTKVVPSKKEEVMEVEEEEEELEEVEEEEEEVEEVLEEEEEEEVEEEEEAEAGVELEEFEYKGATYYRDTENKVFMLDEDGSIGEPIGLWNVIKQKITRLPS